MSKYGYCEDCGLTMESVGCPNCNELDVIEMIESWKARILEAFGTYSEFCYSLKLSPPQLNTYLNKKSVPTLTESGAI